MHITLVAIAKNEGKYISEWLAHHFALGIDKIVVYDNDSKDGTADILNKAGKVYPLECVEWKTTEGVSPQISAYNSALERLNGRTDFIGFIDIDEFLIPTTLLPIRSIFENALSCTPNAGAICVNQRVFGAAGREFYSQEPVLERFDKCSEPTYDENLWVKSFYRMGYVDVISGCHSTALARGVHVHPSGKPVTFVDNGTSCAQELDYSLLQLNHYITKSLEEFMWKRQRGGAAAATLQARLDRYDNMDFFHGRQRGLNAVRDENTEAFSRGVSQVLSEFNKNIGDKPEIFYL